MFHKCTAASLPPEARSVAAELKARHRTAAVCIRSVRIGAPSGMRQSRTVASSPPVATRRGVSAE